MALPKIYPAKPMLNPFMKQEQICEDLLFPLTECYYPLRKKPAEVVRGLADLKIHLLLELSFVSSFLIINLDL